MPTEQLGSRGDNYYLLCLRECKPNSGCRLCGVGIPSLGAVLTAESWKRGVKVTKAQQELCSETEVMLVPVPLQNVFWYFSTL